MANFFSTPKYKRFDYNPMYWNQEKEDLENRLAAYKENKEIDTEVTKSRISNALRRRSSFNSGSVDFAYRNKEQKKSNMKLLMYIVLLCVAAYYLILKFLPKILALVDGSPKVN